MVDSIPVVVPSIGVFDTAAIQIAQAQAQAAANHVNALTYLQKIAEANDVANAKAFSIAPNTVAVDPFTTKGLFGSDASGIAALDVSNVAFIAEFSQPPAGSVSTDSIKAQQLHDVGVLQRDAALLLEAEISHAHAPLSNSATTVDFSSVAQSIATGTSVPPISNNTAFTQTQLLELGSVLKPFANAPLNVALLEQIQVQLLAMQHPIRLSLTTIALAMNLIASLQPSPYHLVSDVDATVDNNIVAPVSAIDGTASEDGTVR